MTKQELIKQFNLLENSFLELSVELKSFISNLYTEQIEMIERMNKLDDQIEELKNG